MALSRNRRWNFDSVDIDHVATWLDSSAPQARFVATTRDKEVALIKKSRATLVVSEQEAHLLSRVAPGATVRVSHALHALTALTLCSAAQINTCMVRSTLFQSSALRSNHAAGCGHGICASVHKVSAHVICVFLCIVPIGSAMIHCVS